MTYTRYGIYFTPPPGPFARTGAAWLGWDIARGRAVPPPDPQVVARPQKYGFHATIKAPFALAPSCILQDLEQTLANFAQDTAPVTLDGLEITRMGPFLAFVPVGDVTELMRLARETVIRLDPFRAPLTDTERTRKSRPNMSPELITQLERFGYPYVLDSFRFHMTLTGPLSADQAEQTADRARAFFADQIPTPMMLDALTLVGEASDGFFHELERYELQGRSPG